MILPFAELECLMAVVWEKPLCVFFPSLVGYDWPVWVPMQMNHHYLLDFFGKLVGELIMALAARLFTLLIIAVLSTSPLCNGTDLIQNIVAINESRFGSVTDVVVTVRLYPYSSCTRCNVL